MTGLMMVLGALWDLAAGIVTLIALPVLLPLAIYLSERNRGQRLAEAEQRRVRAERDALAASWRRHGTVY